MDLGASLKEFRDRYGMSRNALAEILGVSITAVIFWETGRTTPNWRNTQKIQRVLSQYKIDHAIEGQPPIFQSEAQNEAQLRIIDDSRVQAAAKQEKDTAASHDTPASSEDRKAVLAEGSDTPASDEDEEELNFDDIKYRLKEWKFSSRALLFNVETHLKLIASVYTQRKAYGISRAELASESKGMVDEDQIRAFENGRYVSSDLGGLLYQALDLCIYKRDTRRAFASLPANTQNEVLTLLDELSEIQSQLACITETLSAGHRLNRVFKAAIDSLNNQCLKPLRKYCVSNSASCGEGDAERPIHEGA